MKKFLVKPYRWAIVYSILLSGAVIYILLLTFVIPRPISVVKELPVDNNGVEKEYELQKDEPLVITENSYHDKNIDITIETLREKETTFYVADIVIKDVNYLKTAFAKNTYGRNIKEISSLIAMEHKAIFAINGDYYGFRDSGYVLRNGVLYRDIPGDSPALGINNEGSFIIIDNDESWLENNTIWQVLSFGPLLIIDGQIVVDKTTKVPQEWKSNPRTAIGQVSALHYIAIVSDGRTPESAGFSLLALAEEFAKRNCTIAYNLDGGGSSTMYFNGNVINIPTDGKIKKERPQSDIIYVGY